MTPKEKANKLVEKFKPYVYPYSGSGMLVNQEDPEVIKKFAKDCALITVNEILNDGKMKFCGNGMSDPMYTFWTEVKQEVELL